MCEDIYVFIVFFKMTKQTCVFLLWHSNLVKIKQLHRLADTMSLPEKEHGILIIRRHNGSVIKPVETQTTLCESVLDLEFKTPPLSLWPCMPARAPLGLREPHAVMAICYQASVRHCEEGDVKLSESHTLICPADL